ncbi:MAG: hypothetical protein WA432_00310 [Candidatus Babeliaceae bacterium]
MKKHIYIFILLFFNITFAATDFLTSLLSLEQSLNNYVIQQQAEIFEKEEKGLVHGISDPLLEKLKTIRKETDNSKTQLVGLGNDLYVHYISNIQIKPIQKEKIRPQAGV